ncbi:MAG TPA: SAM-dependent chlorinase/fluorinase [Gaiellaceae bacterium]|nr:SAM-dependent chlorinase/fluorinase [Gaiellaceae bacterium]
MIITFLSDFGLQDDFVGTCHGVIKRIAPQADVIDITHGIEPVQVLQGALVLANTLPYMPEGVHLAVVDPGVGTARRPLALESGDGRLYVGPDNGLLVPAAERLGGIIGAWELENPAYRLATVSRTFHGRDLFSPAAAHLASGVPPAELGPAVDANTLTRIDVPVADVRDGFVLAHVLIVDRFGNIQLNLTTAGLSRIGIEPGTRVEVEIGLQRFYACAAATFADVRVGDVVLYEDAYGNVAIAINAGSAAEMLSARSGDPVAITVRPGG